MSVELYYNYDARYLCDAAGDPVQDIPELSFAEQPEWLIHPVRTGGAAYDFSGVAAFRAAVDADFKSETDVMCRSLAESISAGADGILVKLDTDTQRFFDVVNGQESQAAYFELAGLDASGKRVFYLIFRINARMILDPGTTDTLPETSDLFADRTYVMALLRSGWDVEYSADGAQWSSDDTGAEYIRIRNRAAGGEWSDAIPLPRGADGKSLRPDAVGLLADRPATAEEKYCYIATDTGLIYVYLSGAWSEGIPVGQNGADGRGIVSTEKTGSDGLVDHYKITYSDGSTFEYQVKNGEPGQNLKIDATGEAAELATYADAPAGFVFATSVRDENARKTTLYLYVKKSSALNDWCDPLAITYYSKGETLPLIEPLEFQSPEGDAKVLSFQFSKYPAASVASVVIDTALGELTLPYWSALGIEKIIRQSSGQVDIYFGDLCPEFETGRVYFAQGAAEKTLFTVYQDEGGEFSYDEFCEKIFDLIENGGGSGSGTGSIAWSDITGKPETFPPASHTHNVNEIQNSVKSVNGVTPDSGGNVNVSTGSSYQFAKTLADGNEETKTVLVKVFQRENGVSSWVGEPITVSYAIPAPDEEE